MSLRVEHLIRKFGDKVALNNISFEVKKGQAFGLLGGNGAGKTTTIRMILGLLHPNSGTITWQGKRFADSQVSFGYLPEERGLYPKSKVSDQLIYLAKLSGMSNAKAKESMVKWLERFGIMEYCNMRVEELSKGNQQKIQLISTLLHDPELIILDEPFSGLDPVNSELLRDVIKELILQKKTLIFSSHQMKYVEEFCEEICMLKRGNMVLSGNLREIKRSYGRTSLFVRSDQEIATDVESVGATMRHVSQDGFEVHLRAEEDAQKLLRLLIERGVRVDKFDVMEPSLHEIFIEKVGE